MGCCADGLSPTDEAPDCFGECGGDLIVDCSGECGGDLIVDCSGECGGDNSTCTGCMDAAACNYNAEAGIDDGSCEYAEDGFDCDGNQLSLFGGLIPEEYNLHSIYPNPFNPVTNIIYGLPEYTKVHIIIYNITGRHVKTLVNEYQTPGYYSTSWNADGYPSGIYFVNIIAGEYVNTQKLMLVK